jgi:tRNA modification GTPase
VDPFEKNEERRVIDTGYVVYFKAPHSFTGDDVVEFHIHGSIATQMKLMRV